MISFDHTTDRIFWDLNKVLASRVRRRRSNCKLKDSSSTIDNRIWHINKESRRKAFLEPYISKGGGIHGIEWSDLFQLLCQGSKDYYQAGGETPCCCLTNGNQQSWCQRIIRCLKYENECLKQKLVDVEVKYIRCREITQIIEGSEEFCDCFCDTYTDSEDSDENEDGELCESNQCSGDDISRIIESCCTVSKKIIDETVSRRCMPKLSNKIIDKRNASAVLMRKSHTCNEETSKSDRLAGKINNRNVSYSKFKKHNNNRATDSCTKYNFSSNENSSSRINNEVFNEDNCKSTTHQMYKPNHNDSDMNTSYKDICNDQNENYCLCEADEELIQEIFKRDEDSCPETLEVRKREDRKHKKRLWCIKLRLKCLIEHKRNGDCEMRIAQSVISELKTEVELLQERLAKQRTELCQLVSINEHQQVHIKCLERLENELQEICRQRNMLREELESMNMSEASNVEVDRMKSKLFCLKNEVQKLQQLEYQMKEVQEERDKLCLLLELKENDTKSKDAAICDLTQKLNMREECLKSLESMLKKCQSQNKIQTDDCSNSEISCYKDLTQLQEKMKQLQDKFCSQKNIIKNKDKCLREQQSYILEQEEEKKALQEKIKELTRQQIELLKERNALCCEIKTLTNTIKNNT